MAGYPRTTTLGGTATLGTSQRVIQSPMTYTGATTIAGARPATTISSSPTTISSAPTVRTAAPVIQGATQARTLGTPVTTFGTTTASARQATVISGGVVQAATAPRTVIQGGATIMPASTRIVSGAALAPRPAKIISATGETMTITGGQNLTQTAYEVKHKDDPQLQNLKELRKTCGLKTVPVNEALQTFKQGSEDGKLTRDQFYVAYAALLQAFQVEVPGEDVQKAVFDLFDRDDNGVVDMMELICGASLLCTGTEEDKIHAVFNVFDENGDGVISMDEMFKFLTSVFKVVLTPNVMNVMNSMGVTVESPEDLASVTALECFKTADLNHDGRLSVTEFKNWFFAPRNDPSFLFSPVRKLLQ